MHEFIIVRWNTGSIFMAYIIWIGRLLSNYINVSDLEQITLECIPPGFF